jgi:hypothetical protein
MISPAPNTCRLNIQPLGQFRPHRGFLLARSTLPSSVARLLHTAGFRQHRSHIPYLCTTQRPHPSVNLQRDKWLPLSGRERCVAPNAQ